MQVGNRSGTTLSIRRLHALTPSRVQTCLTGTASHPCECQGKTCVMINWVVSINSSMFRSADHGYIFGNHLQNHFSTTGSKHFKTQVLILQTLLLFETSDRGWGSGRTVPVLSGRRKQKTGPEDAEEG